MTSKAISVTASYIYYEEIFGLQCPSSLTLVSTMEKPLKMMVSLTTTAIYKFSLNSNSNRMGEDDGRSQHKIILFSVFRKQYMLLKYNSVHV